MSKELEQQTQKNKNTTEEPVVPESDQFPKKFWGKPISEVLRSYSEAENKIRETSEEAKRLKEKLEALQQEESQEESEQTPTDIVEDELDDYEFLTAAQVKKILQEKDKEFANKIKEVQDQTIQTVMAQLEKRQFIKEHADIFQGKSEEQVNKIIKTIASVGFANGATDLESAYKLFKQTAEEAGLKINQEGEIGTRPIPSNLNSNIANEPSPDDELERMKEFHKKNSGSLSSFIKY